jgi:metal-responsive CopG/Arc/MetJ family transcriptional regulator
MRKKRVAELNAKKGRRRGMRRAAATKKIVVDLPASLIERTERAAARLATPRSKLIRSAVERFLQQLERESLAEELAEGYVANADMDRRIAREFSYVESENI